MLDAMAPGAAVFEPEEVDVLAAACDLARKTIGEAATEPDARAELARLVHNLGRSRLRLNRRLATRSDAAALAAEAADLFHYLRGSGSAPIEDRVLKPIPRTVPIFPAELRMPPSTVLRARAP